MSVQEAIEKSTGSLMQSAQEFADAIKKRGRLRIVKEAFATKLKKQGKAFCNNCITQAKRVRVGDTAMTIPEDEFFNKYGTETALMQFVDRMKPAKKNPRQTMNGGNQKMLMQTSEGTVSTKVRVNTHYINLECQQCGGGSALEYNEADADRVAKMWGIKKVEDELTLTI